MHDKFSESLFWSLQFAEHNMFISKSLDATNIDNIADIKLAQDLECKWREVRAILESDNIVTDIIELSTLTSDFHHKLLNSVKQKWRGYLYPSYMEHIIEEMQYYLDVMNDNMTHEKKILFWLDLLKDHAAMLSHLTDPKEIAAEEFFHMTSHDIQYDMDSNKDNTQKLKRITIENASILNEYLIDVQHKMSKNNFLSVISPDLILHMLREHDRAIQELSKQDSHKEQVCVAQQLRRKLSNS